MQFLKTAFFLLMSLTMTKAEDYFSKQTNSLSTDEKFHHDVDKVVYDLQDSNLIKTKTILDTVFPIGNAKYGILKDSGEIDNKFIRNAVNTKLAILETIKDEKFACVKKLMDKIAYLLEDTQIEGILDLLEMPMFDFIEDMLLIMSSSSKKDVVEDDKWIGINHIEDAISSGPVNVRQQGSTKVLAKNDHLDKYSLVHPLHNLKPTSKSFQKPFPLAHKDGNVSE